MTDGFKKAAASFGKNRSPENSRLVEI